MLTWRVGSSASFTSFTYSSMNKSWASMPFLVEVGGDRVVGRVDVGVGTEMLEAHRLAARRLSDFHRVGKAGLAFGRGLERVPRVISKASLVGLDEHRERPTGRLHARLVHVAFDETERPEDGAVDLVAVGLALDIGEGSRGKVDRLAGRGLALRFGRFAAAWRLREPREPARRWSASAPRGRRRVCATALG